MSLRVDTNMDYEGHGSSSGDKSPKPKKGRFMQVGEYVEGRFFTLYPKAISPNVKSGTSSGGEQ